jgi:hypothetical protein
MKNRTKKILLVGTAAFGILINALYGIGLTASFFDSQLEASVRDVLISAIALEWGWTVLLVSVLFQPFEKRFLLLFTAVPMILGNLFHSLQEILFANPDPAAILLNTVVGLSIAGWFVAAYFLGKPS